MHPLDYKDGDYVDDLLEKLWFENVSKDTYENSVKVLLDDYVKEIDRDTHDCKFYERCLIHGSVRQLTQ
jgi:hypothetical protein